MFLNPAARCGGVRAVLACAEHADNIRHYVTSASISQPQIGKIFCICYDSLPGTCMYGI